MLRATQEADDFLAAGGDVAMVPLTEQNVVEANQSR